MGSRVIELRVSKSRILDGGDREDIEWCRVMKPTYIEQGSHLQGLISRVKSKG